MDGLNTKSNNSEQTLKNNQHITERCTLEEMESSLEAMCRFAGNAELLTAVVNGLENCVTSVAAAIDASSLTCRKSLCRKVNQLVTTIIKTCSNEMKRSKNVGKVVVGGAGGGGSQTTSPGSPLTSTPEDGCPLTPETVCSQARGEQAGLDALKIVLQISIDTLRRHRALQFIALIHINLLVDVCILDQSNLREDSKDTQKCSTIDATAEEQEPGTIGSVNDHVTRIFQGISKPAKPINVCTDDVPGTNSTLDTLGNIDPDVLIELLTRKERDDGVVHLMGCAPKCTPSVRRSSCQPHCTQVLAARVLAVACAIGGNVEQSLLLTTPTKVVSSAPSCVSSHISSLTEILDPNCDPHLLCLVLQTLARIALRPRNHQSLIDIEMPDTLMQLLLPSDEWYYTNHSTRYASYVKYHAARILVYMGMFQKLGGRVNLFDMKSFETRNTCNIISASSEDIFIDQMALGKLLIKDARGNIIASSLESLVTELMKYYDRDSNKSNNDDSLGELLLCSLPMIVHPLIVMRLLVHKMFANMLRRRKQAAVQCPSSASSTTGVTLTATVNSGPQSATPPPHSPAIAAIPGSPSIPGANTSAPQTTTLTLPLIEPSPPLSKVNIANEDYQTQVLHSNMSALTMSQKKKEKTQTTSTYPS